MLSKLFFNKEGFPCPVRTGISMFVLCIACVLLFSGCAELTGTDDLKPENNVFNTGGGTIVLGNQNDTNLPTPPPEPTSTPVP